MTSLLNPRWSVALPRHFDSASRELDELLEQFMGNRLEGMEKLLAPATVWEEEGHWCVEVDLPGFRLEDIDVTLEKNTVRLIAERQPPRQERKFFHQERAYGRIQRTFALPETVNSDAIEANLKDGVLRVTLAKRAELQPKKITVKSNPS